MFYLTTHSTHFRLYGVSLYKKSMTVIIRTMPFVYIELVGEIIYLNSKLGKIKFEIVVIVAYNPFNSLIENTCGPLILGNGAYCSKNKVYLTTTNLAYSVKT